MGKLLDWIMTGFDWEEMQRIAVYKALAKRLENGEELSISELAILNKNKKKQ